MEQAQLFQDSTQWLSALRADVDAAGGEKIVGCALWPHLDADTASRKLSNALNTKQKQQLGYVEVQQVKRLARIAVGKSQLHAFESKQLECDLHWRTQEDVAELARQTFATLAEQAKRFHEDLQRSAVLISGWETKR